MSVHVTETWNAMPYAFTDPDVFLHCDNPDCKTPWLTRTGLVAWAVGPDGAQCSRFTDRLLVACSRECLDAAMRTHRCARERWSAPVVVAVWIEALRRSLDLDPTATPIGEFARIA